MYLNELSEYLLKLEKTTLRNEMVVLLSDLFKKTNSSEIDKICYLLQGRVSSLFDSVEFGMADKMVITAISKALNIEKKKIIELFKEKGDLGTTAEIIKTKFKPLQTDIFKSKKLTVNDTYDVFFQLAKSTGEGSVDKKVNLLAGLIRNADSLSCRFIIRIPLDKLRLGFSDMTVLDGLSHLISGTKEKRKEIEKYYNVRPDLGYIAKTLKEKGISGLNHIIPKIGIPILMAKADRLSSPKEILEQIGKCAVEFKYDGLRLQIHYKRAKDQKSKGSKEQTIKLFSRNLEDVTPMFPDIVEAVKKQIHASEIIFEGEVVAYNPKTGVSIPFQQTMQRKRKYDIEKVAKEIPVKLYAFELLYLNGGNFIHKPYAERKKELKNVIHKGETIIYADEIVTDSENEIETLFSEALRKGFEGIMAKKLTGVYQAGMRGWNWIKYKKAMSKKLMDTFDVLVMGYTLGEGKRTAFGVGQFLTGVYDGESDKFTTITKIGTGLTDEQFREFVKRTDKLKISEKPKNYDADKLLDADIWLKPSLVVEIGADEITRSQVHTTGRIMGPSKSGKAQEVKTAGYALRFPKLISFRDDKNLKEVTTVDEVIKMFGKQKK